MVIKFLRETRIAAALLALLRLYVGYEWITGGIHKLKDGFDATGFLQGAVAKPVVDHATNALVYPNFVAFIKHFALPNAGLFNFVIPLGETLVGLGLILGCLTATAAFFGMLMNFMFMFAGTVSTNPWLILLGLFIVVAGANAGRYGADYYVLPFLRRAAHKIAEAVTHRGGKGGAGRKTPAHA